MDRTNGLFVSYRSLERAFAAKLSADLKNAGFSVWIDRMDILPGSLWDAAIAEAIDGCMGLIAIISPSYVRSEICLNELARAQRAGRPIIPVLLEPLTDAGDWPLLIQRRQYVDFTSWTDTALYRGGLDELLEEIHRNAAGSAGSPPDPETRYLNLLLADLESARGVLEYVNLDAAVDDSADDRQQEDESGFDLLLDIQSVRAEAGISRLHDLDQVLGERRQLVILGEAGSGKSTTLRWLARRAALARRAGPRVEPLPVFATLGQWREGESFDEFLAGACPLVRNVQRPLASSDLLLLLDGLNELGADATAKVQALRSWVSAQREPPRIAVTCRTEDYALLKLGDWPVAALRALDESQIRQFASRYLLSRSDRFLAQVLPDRLSARGGRTMLAELAPNPYMLSALIYLYQVRPEELLPTNSGILFSKLARALWAREERRRQRCRLPPAADWTTARHALASLALALVERSAADDVPAAQVIPVLGDALLRLAIDASLLSQNGAFVRFYHGLLRTYFAAEALADAEVETLDRWCRDHVRQWQTVAVAWSGISPRADEFLVKSNWQDAADLIGSGFVASGAALQKPFARALEELSVDYWRSFQPAIDALICMGQAVVPLLIDALQDVAPDVRAKVVFVLGRIADPRSAPALLALLDDPADEVRGRVLPALETVATPEVLTALAALASDPLPGRRETAARAIGKLGDTRRAGALRALLSDSDAVRRAAAHSLGVLQDVDSVPGLTALMNDPEAETRAVAVRALMAIGSGDLQVTITTALGDSDDNVRLAAMDGIQALGREQATSWLLSALRDGSEGVRQHAAGLLGTIAGERALEPLTQALDQPSPQLATTAAQALGRIGGAQARALLLDRLRGEVPALWAACAGALEADGWLPASVPDIVRTCAARGDWTRCLALGSETIEDLRDVLRIGTDAMRRGAAETLHALGWSPREPNAEWFRYAVARGDWVAEHRQHLGERPSLLGWIGSHSLSRGPVWDLVEELVPDLTGRLDVEAFVDAIAADDLQLRYVATVAAAVAPWLEAAPLIVENLNAPDNDAHPALEYGVIRVVSAQALGHMGFGQAMALLDHAARGMRSGISVFSNASTVAAVQAAARVLGITALLDRIPALALGRKRENDNNQLELDMWAVYFPLADLSVLERYSVSSFVEALATFDRSKLPAFTMQYNDMAYWELHTRLAVLSLACIAGTFVVAKDLAAATLMHFWDHTAAPVLREVDHWGGPGITEFAHSELQRRRQTEHGV